MFDISAEVVLRLMTPAGLVKIPVRFPTDDEYVTWRRQKKVLQKDLGRRNFTIERSKGEPCDLKLLTTIRRDENGPEIDEADAHIMIAQLTDCDVSTRPQQEGKEYVIEMTALKKFKTSHRLRIPSMKEQMAHHGTSVVHGAYGYQEIRLNPASAGELYDKLVSKIEGYKNAEKTAVPVSHKAEVINVLQQEIQLAMEEAVDTDEDQDR